MKLDGLLLKRAAANRDMETILQIFCTHMAVLRTNMAVLRTIGPAPWRICESYDISSREMRLETLGGSFHWINGLFRLGGHWSSYRIVYHPHFYMDAV
jgi:hypothetical protein